MGPAAKDAVWVAAYAVLGLSVAAAAPGANAQDHDFRPAETAQIAQGFMHQQYELKDLVGAKQKYYTPDFIQHNPEIASGMTGDKTFIDARGARDPAHFQPLDQWVNKVDHVLVDDKLFAIHHRLFTSPQDRGREFFDIWRVENGKMVEHWDVIQDIPEHAQNDNTTWSDLKPSVDPAPGDPRPEQVIRQYLRIGLDQDDPLKAADLFIADDFRQHSAHIADGKAALIAYFKAKATAPRFNYVSHILADRDLVLVTHHATTGTSDPGQMYADLFRVRAGKIVEHWDAIEAVPKTSVNGNTMW